LYDNDVVAWLQSSKPNFFQWQ